MGNFLNMFFVRLFSGIKDFGNNHIFIIFLLLFSAFLQFPGCKEAPDVTVDPWTQSSVSGSSGTLEPQVSGVYPSDGTTDAPVDVDVVIVFSRPLNTSTAPSNISVSGVALNAGDFSYSADNRIVTVDVGILSASATYDVTIDTGIESSDGYALAAQYVSSFDTGVDISAQYLPEVIAVSRYPSDGSTGISKSLQYVEVTFSRDINPATVTAGGTFTIAPNVANSITQINAKTYQLTLNTLTYGQTYTVTLTSGIQDDLFGNALVLDGNESWSFTIENDPDTGPGTQSVTSVWISSVGTDTATIYFTTNYPVTAGNNLFIDYDTGTAYGSTTAAVDGNNNTVHSVTIPSPPSPALTQGTRYYYRIRIPSASISQTTDPATGYLLTLTTDGVVSGNSVLNNNGNNNSDLSVIQSTDINGNLDGSSYVIWKNGNSIMGQHFSTTGGEDWVSGTGETIDNGTTTIKSNPRIFSDGHGYAIVTLENGGTIYAKRIDDTAGTGPFAFDVNWPGNDVANNGITVGTGTNPSAVVVWGGQGDNNVDGGFVTKVTSGTATHNIPANPLYDFDVDLRTGITTSDHVIDASYNHTTLDITSQNFRHVIGQTGSTVVTSGENFYIGADATKVSDTATDHQVLDTASTSSNTYTNSGTNAYTSHGFTDTIGISNLDLITDGNNNWGRVTGADSAITIGGTTSLDSGTQSLTSPNQLIDSGASWIGFVLDYSLVENTTTPGYAYVIIGGVVNDSTLNISQHIFSSGCPGTCENYNIYTGEYCFTHPTVFTTFYNIPILPSNLIVATEIFTIYKAIVNGTADTPPANPLYDDNNLLAITVALDDAVINTLTFDNNPVIGNPRNVEWVTDNTTYGQRALALSSNLAFNLMADADTYEVLRFGGTSNVADATILETGDFSAVATNLTTDDLNYPADYSAVASGDVVYNITRDDYAVITNANNTTKVLTLSKDVQAKAWAASDTYIIFDSNMPLVDAGQVTATGNPFTDTDNDFSNVNIGDIVHNNSTGQDDVVTAKAGNTLTLKNGITMNVNDNYIVIQPRVFFTFEYGGNIYAELFRLRDASSYASVTVYNGGNSQNSRTVQDGAGGAFVIYENNPGSTIIYAKWYDGAGNILVGGGSASPGTPIWSSSGTAYLLDVQYDNNNGAYVLYIDSGDVYLRKLNSNRTLNTLSVTWTQSFAGSDPVLALDSSSRPMIAYADGTGNILVNKYDTGGGPIYTGVVVHSLGEYAFTDAVTEQYKSNISVISDGSDGAIISWFDMRYYPQIGYALFANRIDGAGVYDLAFDADSGAGTDYDGFLIGIVSVWDPADLSIKSVFYDDGAPPFGGTFIWLDYRSNSRWDIYYDQKN